MENEWLLPIKAPTYVPIQAPKKEELILGIAKVTANGINLARTDPKKAKEYAKTYVLLGAGLCIAGAIIWALVKCNQ